MRAELQPDGMAQSPMPVDCNRRRIYHNQKKYPMVLFDALIVGKEGSMKMDKYIATIITPFHNTDLKLFRSAFESVCGQTIGTDKIEWIIVVHNSEKEYLEGVREMTKDYDTMIVYELNNDIHSASSPRNFALEKARGKYLF